MWNKLWSLKKNMLVLKKKQNTQESENKKKVNCVWTDTSAVGDVHLRTAWPSWPVDVGWNICEPCNPTTELAKQNCAAGADFWTIAQKSHFKMMFKSQSADLCKEIHQAWVIRFSARDEKSVNVLMDSVWRWWAKCFVHTALFFKGPPNRGLYWESFLSVFLKSFKIWKMKRQ